MLSVSFCTSSSCARSRGISRGPGARHLSQRSEPLLLHETIFRRFLAPSFDSFSVVPVSSQANFVVFRGFFEASACEKERKEKRKDKRENRTEKHISSSSTCARKKEKEKREKRTEKREKRKRKRRQGEEEDDCTIFSFFAGNTYFSNVFVFI